MFKKLKSLFIVEVHDNESKKKVADAKKQEEKPAVPPKSRPIQHVVEGGDGKVTDQFLNVLFDSMEKNNLEGFDYLEFKQSLLSLKKVEMDENTRFKSAFAMAQTMGATAAHLIKTAQYYLGLLAKEEEKFEKALNHQMENRIGAKELEIQKLDQLVNEKEKQIEKLKQEITEHRSQVESLRKYINEAMSKIASTKNDFIASYNSLVGQINKDIENIKKYLQ